MIATIGQATRNLPSAYTCDCSSIHSTSGTLSEKTRSENTSDRTQPTGVSSSRRDTHVAAAANASATSAKTSQAGMPQILSGLGRSWFGEDDQSSVGVAAAAASSSVVATS